MSQKQLILEMLWDEQPHTAFDIFQTTRVWRVAARISELKKDGYQIESYRDSKVHSKHWYRLVGR